MTCCFRVKNILFKLKLLRLFWTIFGKIWATLKSTSGHTAPKSRLLLFGYCTNDVGWS